jgi:hypothetical protein
MIKALKAALAFLLLWIVVSTFLFVYSDILWSGQPDPGNIVLATSSDWTFASATLPIISNYGDPLAILEPIQVLKQYQKEHSTRALQQDTDATERKFLVAYYYGPDRAGNILHNFFNSIMWAVATNRTVLWEYYVDRGHSNSVQDCEKYLKRNPWLPSYSEWSRKLRLAAPVPVRAHDMLSSLAQVVVAPQIRDIYPKNAKIARVKWSDDPAHLLQERPHPWSLNFLTRWSWSWRNSNNVIQVEQERIIRRLYSRGLVFLYGMLFQACFTIAVNTTATTAGRPHNSATRPTDTSIALHSRHTVAADDGSYVEDEIACLQKLLLPTAKASFTPCWVYLMSDRPKTLELLSAWLLARNCTPVVTSTSINTSTINKDTTLQPHASTFETTTFHKHNNNNNNNQHASSSSILLDEHGPRSGAGFLEDLIMASAARTGFIGVEARQQGLPARSSTALVLEKIEYDRTVEAVTSSSSTSSGSGSGSSSSRYHQLQLGVLQRCALPFRDETKGYTYGPSTPMFRRNATWIKQVHRERNDQSRREQQPPTRGSETAVP